MEQFGKNLLLNKKNLTVTLPIKLCLRKQLENLPDTLLKTIKRYDIKNFRFPILYSDSKSTILKTMWITENRNRLIYLHFVCHQHYLSVCTRNWDKCVDKRTSLNYVRYFFATLNTLSPSLTMCMKYLRPPQVLISLSNHYIFMIFRTLTELYDYFFIHEKCLF